MRRITAWIGGVASGIVAYRFWRRHQTVEAPAEQEADIRADELRAKIAETRAAEPEPAAEPVVEEPLPAEPEAAVAEAAVPEEPAAEEPAQEPAAPDEPESVDERRQRVHEEGRAAIDEMQSE